MQSEARYGGSGSSDGLPNPNEDNSVRGDFRRPPQRNTRVPASAGSRRVRGANIHNPEGAMRAAQAARAGSPTHEDDLFSVDASHTGKKKRIWLRVVAGVMAVLVLGISGLAVYRKVTYKPPVYVIQPVYENTGRFTLDSFKDAIVAYDTEKLELGTVAESWLVKELDYANKIEARENFIKSICAYVNFTYPTVQAKTSDGNLAVDSQGQAIMQDADMLSGENFTVTIVDYNNLSATMKEDAVLIASLYEKSGYHPTDYTYRDDMVNLMIDYILSKPNLPTKTVEISLPVQEVQMDVTAADGTTSTEIKYVVTDDAVLDNLLFGSEEFHNMCDTFGTICYQYDNNALVGVNAPEPSAFDDSSLGVETADSGGEDVTSGIEVSESANETSTDVSSSDSSVVENEDSEKSSDTISGVEGVDKTDKAEQADSEASTALSEPTDDITTEEDTEPALPHNEEGYVYESVIPYTWVGAYFLTNEYTGELNPVAQEGDGTFELPAAIDTSVVTKVLCADGNYHDVRVTLKGYWVGEDAVNYTIGYSEKNRGFDKNSSLQLICFEVEVENLEDNPITVQSELYLSDKQSNPSVRTGNVYGFLDSATIQPGESVVLQDWATSTELPTKYVCWGKSFKRKYPVVWFKLLAGSGESVEDYNANTNYQPESQSESQNENN